jgi:hypothetical protein
MTTQTTVAVLTEPDTTVLQPGTNTIAPGRLLVQHGVNLPKSLLLRSEPAANGWNAVEDSRSTFETTVLAAGWTFFYMAGEIKTTVFGFDRQKALRTATKRLLARVQSQFCNCIEITAVKSNSFLRVPYVSVSAHSRHLQKGRTFSGRPQC